MTVESANSPAAKFLPLGIMPTAEQVAIQIATARSIVIEANAGAAKTTTLALRIGESLARGVTPERILALTYTETAVDALRSALKGVGVPYSASRRLRVETFDSLSAQILGEYHGRQIELRRDPEILVPAIWDAVALVERSAQDWPQQDLLLPTVGNVEFVHEFLRINANLKGTMQDTLEREGGRVDADYAAFLGVDFTQLKVWLAYERLRLQNNAGVPKFWGRGDPTYDLACLLADGESVASFARWPDSVGVLALDEMHDLNRSTFTVLHSLLTSNTAYFCGAGDIDQVIHESSGADARFMMTELESRFSRAPLRMALTRTFRFSDRLAEAAGRLARKTYASGATHQTDIRLLEYKDAGECAELAVDAALSSGRGKLSDVAILFRHGYQTVEIENALLAKDVPYSTRGFESYLRRPEVLFVRGLLAIATGGLQDLDSETRASMMHALIFFAGSKIDTGGDDEKTQAELLRDAVALINESPGFMVDAFFENQVLRNANSSMARRLKAAVSSCRNGVGHHGLQALFDTLAVGSVVNEVFQTPSRRREALGNIYGLKAAATFFAGAGDFFKTLNARDLKLRQLKKTSSVVLARVVDVKGLEFPEVIVPFMEAGQFPAADHAWRDERNKFYVAITRAKRKLTILSSKSAPSSLVDAAFLEQRSKSSRIGEISVA